VLAEGTTVPTFELSGVEEGVPREYDLGDYVGENILVVVFYPADFNPACDEDSTDLTELDLFTMQKDVDIFAISPDSVFSHQAFAEEYSLSIPLLSDTHGEAIEAFDVEYEDSDQLLAQRAVFVVDQEGTIQYTWSTSDLEERPDVDEVREAVSSIGGDSTAVGRYRVGHAHYIEARRAFTSAMDSYEDRDWLIAQGDFERAMEEFQESADQFQSAVRFAESEPLEAGFERAQEKATALWQAAEWLSDSANQYASGNGEEADNYRQDAETPLERARDIGEPPDPDDIDVDQDGVGEATEAGEDSPDLASPSDPALDEDTSEPGAEASGEPGDDEDIDAAVQEVQVDDPDDDADDEDEDPIELDLEGGTDEEEDATADDVAEAAADGPGLRGQDQGAADAPSGQADGAADAAGNGQADGVDASATGPNDDGEAGGPDQDGDGAEADEGDDEDEDIELDLTDPNE
jgi:peroxiredoxin